MLGRTDADEILRFLENRNLFTFRVEGSDYRYHHLFRSFLAAKGKEQNAERYNGLHVKAGHLCADQGLWNEAIEHYLTAAAWENAAQAIGAVSRETFERGQWTKPGPLDGRVARRSARQPAAILFYRGKLSMDTGDFVTSASLFDRARVEFSRHGDQAGVAKALVEESMIHYCRGDMPRAIENSRRALALLGEENSVTAGRAHRGLGTSLVLQGDFANAISELQQALLIFERQDRFYDVAIVHHDLGVGYERMGNLSLSALHYEQALRYWQRISNPGGTANTLNSLGVTQHYQGRYMEALETLEDALLKSRDAAAPRAEAYALASLGDLYRDLSDYPHALNAYESALEIGKRKEEAFVTTYALLGIGDTYCLQKNLDVTRYYLEQALEYATRHQSRYEIALCKLSLGVLHTQLNDLQGAEEALLAVCDTFRQDGAKRELGKATLHLANVTLLAGRPQDAERHLQSVITLSKELPIHAGCRDRRPQPEPTHQVWHGTQAGRRLF